MTDQNWLWTQFVIHLEKNDIDGAVKEAWELHKLLEDRDKNGPDTSVMITKDAIRVLLTAFVGYFDEPGYKTQQLQWAVERWKAEVNNRPLTNVHRRTLDDTWRQVVRHLGGDPDTLLGPPHDEMVRMAALL